MNTIGKTVQDGHLASTLDIICNKVPEKKKNKDEIQEDFELNYSNDKTTSLWHSPSHSYVFHINIDILTMTYS